MMILAHALPLTMVGEGGGDLGTVMAGTEGDGAVLPYVQGPSWKFKRSRNLCDERKLHRRHEEP